MTIRSACRSGASSDSSNPADDRAVAGLARNCDYSTIRIFVVIRLLGRPKFVDRRKNSVVPSSNEFGIQPVDPARLFLPANRPMPRKVAIFAVFGAPTG